MKKVSVMIPDKMYEQIEQLVDEDIYKDVSEAIRDAVRQLVSNAREKGLLGNKRLENKALVKGADLLKLAECDILNEIKRLILEGGRKLNLSIDTIAKAINVAEKYVEIVGCPARKPSTVASGCLYIASYLNDERRIQREIQEAFGKHPYRAAPLRSCYKEICEVLGKDLFEIFPIKDDKKFPIKDDKKTTDHH